MSEMVGFNGPIYMTTPTKAICPILLVREASPSATRRAVSHLFMSGNILTLSHHVLYFGVDITALTNSLLFFLRAAPTCVFVDYVGRGRGQNQLGMLVCGNYADREEWRQPRKAARSLISDVLFTCSDK